MYIDVLPIFSMVLLFAIAIWKQDKQEMFRKHICPP